MNEIIKSFLCSKKVSILAAIFLLNIIHANAQNTATIAGIVKTEEGKALQGVNVFIKGTNRGGVTNSAGYYKIHGVPAGEHTVTAEFVGRESQSWKIIIKREETFQKDFTLAIKPLLMPGVVVTASQTGEIAESLSVLSPNVIRRSPIRVTGELMREIPGVDAVRKGPVGLDPVIRGLRETEVAAYIDGSRMFPAGPLRMDSPISHIDPNAIQKIHVVKGPYALTWGAGNLSAIQVETANIPPLSRQPFNGTVASGYHTNLNAADVSASVMGNQGRLSYWTSGTWREGDDYEAGDPDSEVPADFKSREIRGKLGVQLAGHSQLTFSGGYQRQDGIDYPGRLLNADFFNSTNFSGRWLIQRAQGLLRSLDVIGYYNYVDHRMDNTGKPTAEPGTFANGNPRPPLDIEVNSEIQVLGGRLAANLVTRTNWDFELGMDIYSANRDATRTLTRKDNGALLFTDLMWPDATITDFGTFARATRQFDRDFKLSGTLRLDLVKADADTVSNFFLENNAGDLDDSEVNVSGAITLSKRLAEHWVLSLGAGSAVRTADATERYSDRIPASKAQTTAEFVGNPGLDPERSSQIDLWLEANYQRFSFNANVFARKMADYITLELTDLPKRLPLSPETVFRYINGDAKFWGFEASARYNLTQSLSLKIATQYLWGKDEGLDEPALGIPPFGVDGALRFDAANKRFFVEGTIHGVAEQDRVAKTRGETPTDGYVTADLIGGVQLWQGVELRAGVMNVTDKSYINHLNAKNPFTGEQIPEPGRVLFTNLSYAF